MLSLLDFAIEVVSKKSYNFDNVSIKFLLDSGAQVGVIVWLDRGKIRFLGAPGWP